MINTRKRFYWLWAAIGLLLLLNLATVGWVVRRVSMIRENRRNPAGFLIKRLALTPDQTARYRQSRTRMQSQLKPREDSLRLLRSALFNRVKQPTVSDTALTQLLNQIAVQNGHITRLRFRHWQEVRALCTPEQQARFDKLVSHIDWHINNAENSGLREPFRQRF